MSMSWPYMIPTLNDAPERLFEWGKGGLTTTDLELPRLGVYCAEESHKGAPWFIGSFEPNTEWLEETGEFRWTFSYYYVTGDGYLLNLAYAKYRLLKGDKRTSSKEDPFLMYDPEVRGREELECGTCAYRRVYRQETYQHPVSIIVGAGMKETTLSMLDSAIRRAGK